MHRLEGADRERWSRVADVQRLGLRAGIDSVRASLDDAIAAQLRAL